MVTDVNYDGILFDLDGTLWDATGALAISWGETLKAVLDIKQPLTMADIQKVMGMTREPLVQTLFPYLPLERGIEIFELCTADEIVYLAEHGAVLYDGVVELLESLSKKLPLCIVSNCNAGYIESFLTAHNTGQFITDHECIGSTGLQKADNIRLVVERNHLHHPVYVGDTAIDATAAAQAGVPFIHAAYGFGEVDCPLKITKPCELLGLL